MKKLLFLISISILFSSCISSKMIGKVNMISTRNVDPKLNYTLLSSYVGEGSLYRTKSKTLDDAINSTVKKVPGGEFLMNAKIYVLSNGYIHVSGDVWGIPTDNFNGFKIGDKVTFKLFNEYTTGVITGFKDNEKAIVKRDKDQKIVEIDFSNLIKSNQ